MQSKERHICGIMQQHQSSTGHRCQHICHSTNNRARFSTYHFVSTPASYHIEDPLQTATKSQLRVPQAVDETCQLQTDAEPLSSARPPPSKVVQAISLTHCVAVPLRVLRNRIVCNTSVAREPIRLSPWTTCWLV